MKCTWLLVLCVIGIVLCIEHDFKGFDDSILFGINWPGSQNILENLADGDAGQSQEIKSDTKNEILKVTSSDKEKYECRLPELQAPESISFLEYDGPSPMHLLKPLFYQKICSYRLESYWSYEVCHGRYIRQYHEERDGKQVKTQEYNLGHWNMDRQLQMFDEQENSMLWKTTKVEGVSLPCLEMHFDGGTICDLSGKPRVTTVLYVCYSHGKHEIYSFKEISTCEYEIIILSPLLCEHPQFKPKEVTEKTIDCVPVGDSPKKPRSLLKQEVDSLRFHHQSVRLANNDKDMTKDVLAVLKVEKINKDGETHLKLELHPLIEDEVLETPDNVKPQPMGLLSKPPVITDDSPVRAFLNGDNCLNGGTGWWKYEFCYGKHVVQYHIDRDNVKTTVLLGRYSEQAHLQWVKDNKGKVPRPVEHRTSVSHFYSNGDHCDKTDKPRQTEVKLKCLENSSSPAQVSLYLLEPRTCHYILGVESPLICDILPLADENGLIQPAKSVLVKQEAVVEIKVEEDKDTKQKEVPKIEND